MFPIKTSIVTEVNGIAKSLTTITIIPGTNTISIETNPLILIGHRFHPYALATGTLQTPISTISSYQPTRSTITRDTQQILSVFISSDASYVSDITDNEDDNVSTTATAGDESRASSAPPDLPYNNKEYSWVENYKY
eukprot:473307_1